MPSSPGAASRAAPPGNVSCRGVRGEGLIFGDTAPPPKQLCMEEKPPAWHGRTSPKSPRNHWGPGVCLCPPHPQKKTFVIVPGWQERGRGGRLRVGGGTWSCGQHLGVPVVMG